jgi:methionyl-tRNA formyltransferase
MISKLLLIGANRFAEDGPLLEFVKICQERDIDVHIVSDEPRRTYPTESLGNFQDAVRQIGAKYTVLGKKIDKSVMGDFASQGYHALCVNCHWIIPKDIIELFEGRFFNYHNSALPDQRGGACHTWRIMQGIQQSRMTFHEVVPAVDQGEVVLEQSIEYPQSAKNLEENYAFLAKYEGEFFRKFLDSDLTLSPQQNVPTFYWPRLNTEINGFIDWSWRAADIRAFCDAFDRPFAGASTYQNNRRIRLRDVHLSDVDAPFHPFQAGLIYRMDNGSLFVAAVGGGLEVRDYAVEGDMKLREGMRLATPPDRLYKARIGVE